MIDTLTRSATAEPEIVFRNLIVEPLESVLGETLLSVSYGILNYDKSVFPVEQPNKNGVLFASLHFGNTTLEISWGFDKSLRGGDLAYHVQVLPAGETYGAAMNDGSICEIAHVDAVPWRQIIGKKLTGVEVIGFQDSPQAVRLDFFGRDVVVAVGYGGSELWVGDGDDVLVFSGREWQSTKSVYGAEWQSLWQAQAA